jgi:flavin-dependent dehydrogenase
MNNSHAYYDVAIAGGGLAGLSTAIVLGRNGYRVVLFEKEVYPFHKVCGEYISLESEAFLESLGLPLAEWDLPMINTLSLSSQNGSILTQELPLGGFGISRFKIDYALVNIARETGVHIMDNTRVQDIIYTGDHFTIFTDKINYHSTVCCGAFGKRSNVDVRWKRSFVQKKPGALNNYIGVKYHAKLDHPRHLISLHNFKNGYCGIAPVENGTTCICYLTTAQNLREHGNNLEQMEEEVLFKNPFLKNAFSSASFIYDKPLTISQISFDKKEQVENHVLLTGDAAGLITPLCGNGMSMALHSGRLASGVIINFLEGGIDRATMENEYTDQWRSAFAGRLKAGRIIQRLFGNEKVNNLMIRTLRHFPGVVKSIIKQTHGVSI